MGASGTLSRTLQREKREQNKLTHTKAKRTGGAEHKNEKLDLDVTAVPILIITYPEEIGSEERGT